MRRANVSAPEADDRTVWAPTWTQAMTDFRGEHDEPPFDDVTVRMTVPASIGGSHIRAELSNRFGDEPVRIGRAALGVGNQSVETTFDGLRSTEIPVGESRWTDPIELTVRHGDDIVVDIYLPEPTPYTSANGFAFDRSRPGDFVGSRDSRLQDRLRHSSARCGSFLSPALALSPAPMGPAGLSLPEARSCAASRSPELPPVR